MFDMEKKEKIIEKKTNFKIDKETAKQEFENFCEAWEIDTDTEGMNEEDVSGFDNQKNHFIKAVMRGRMSLNGDETLRYTFSEKSEKLAGQEITIKRPKGASYMEMDGFKDKQLIRKTYAVMAAMSGKQVSYFSNIDGVDLKPLQAIITLFLAG